MNNILIVDDNVQNRYMLEAALKGGGYSVTAAENGAEALRLAQKTPPDLVISDILMPVMDGYELCRRWRADARLRRIPFIIYTATYTDVRDEEFGLRLGADKFLIKPVKVEILQAAVREVLEAGRKGLLRAAGAHAEDEGEVLKEYNKVMFRKLQKKVAELQAEAAARAEAEAALRESEARFRSLIEAAPDAIFVESGGKFLYLNPAMVRLVGAGGAQELVGQELLERVAPEYRAQLKERCLQKGEPGKAFPPLELEYLRLDGTSVSVECTSVQILYAGLDSQLVFLRDISRRKRREARAPGAAR